MLSGQAPFAGETVTDVIAAVVTKEPPWSALPAATPPAVRRLLERSLRKEETRRTAPRRRRPLEIEEALRGRGGADGVAAARAGPAMRELAAWTMAGLPHWPRWRWPCVGGGPGRSEPRAYRSRSLAGHRRGAPRRDLADGRHLAFTSRGRLWVRSAGRGPSPSLSRDGRREEPFWSPDSRSIGFFSAGSAGNTLKTVGIAGAPPETVAEVPAGWAAGTWSSSGAILVEITETAEGEGWHLVRPGSRATLVPRVPRRPTGQPGPGAAAVPARRHSLPLHLPARGRGLPAGRLDRVGETQALVRADSQAVYVAPGYVLYVRDGVLLAQPFDAPGPADDRGAEAVSSTTSRSSRRPGWPASPCRRRERWSSGTGGAPRAWRGSTATAARPGPSSAPTSTAT